MSRTDVHRPWPVQQSDPYNRHLLVRYQIWPDRVELMPVKNMCCGCNLCTGRLGHRAARRAERTWWRSIRAQLLAAAGDDRDDLDVPPFRGEAY